LFVDWMGLFHHPIPFHCYCWLLDFWFSFVPLFDAEMTFFFCPIIIKISEWEERERRGISEWEEREWRVDGVEGDLWQTRKSMRMAGSTSVYYLSSHSVPIKRREGQARKKELGLVA